MGNPLRTRNTGLCVPTLCYSVWSTDWQHELTQEHLRNAESWAPPWPTESESTFYQEADSLYAYLSARSPGLDHFSPSRPWHLPGGHTGQSRHQPRSGSDLGRMGTVLTLEPPSRSLCIGRSHYHSHKHLCVGFLVLITTL